MALYLNDNINESSIVIQNSHQIQFENKKEKIAFSWFIQSTKMEIHSCGIMAEHMVLLVFVDLLKKKMWSYCS